VEFIFNGKSVGKIGVPIDEIIPINYKLNINVFEG